MITSKQLTLVGIPNIKEIMPLALKTVNCAVSEGAIESDMLRTVSLLVQNPSAEVNDPRFDVLAAALHGLGEHRRIFIPRAEPAPWRQWGEEDVEDSALAQMRNACNLPNAVRGALMPDAHTGYGLPIGGVLAVRGAVIPYAVGVDIACRMRLTVLDMPVKALTKKRERLIAAIEQETRFGLGAEFDKGERRSHAVMDYDWSVCPTTNRLKDKAAKQLGSSGGGNHFVEFGELVLEAPALGLEAGTYLALLSHSGSRGTGEAVAKEYSSRAMSMHPELPKELQHLAWLDRESAEGQEYWAAMTLMGAYASANHELIHQHVLGYLGADPLAAVENHHNFAWEEEYDGETLVVHRKGATPAGQGVLGIVPGSMGTPGFVVQGKGNALALNSCSHGAGRLMSRTAANAAFTWKAIHARLADAGVELISGGLDEAPMAYKDIHAVMAAQSDLVDILARFEPRLVKMAPDTGGKRNFKKKSCW